MHASITTATGGLGQVLVLALRSDLQQSTILVM
jgi:hypothetical protein